MAISTRSPNGAAPRETPVRRQWQQLKAEHPDCLLLFQLGDFFECFEEDARTLARRCGITLTSRELGKGDRVALAGVPVGRLEYFLSRLVAAGLHVAVAEQVSPPGGGLVERVITRVVTPGTLTEPGLLREKENTYLAAVCRGRHGVGLAYADVSTGEFALTQLDGDEAGPRLRGELERLLPAELLLPADQQEEIAGAGHLTPCQPWRFDPSAAQERLCRHFGVLSLEGFGCAHLPLAIGAAGAILSYLEEHNPRLLPSLAGPRTYSAAGGMVLDAATRRNLEVFRNARGGRLEGSLLAAIDRTLTPMGGRLLRRWLLQPLLDRQQIDARLDAVEAFVERDGLRTRLRGLFGHVGDLERQLGRVAQGVATSRELLDMAASLRQLGHLGELLDGAGIGALADAAEGTDIGSPGENSPGRSLRKNERTKEVPGREGTATGDSPLDACPDVARLIVEAIAPPDSGRLIRPGFSLELDELAAALTGARRWGADLERTERERTGIRSLKVGFNKVFGYYLEVTRPNLSLVPDDYRRKQTLTSAERFVTPELKDWEARVVGQEERVAALERGVFDGVLARVAAQGPRLKRLAEALARLDVFAALADLARARDYCRPRLADDQTLAILDGRHAVVEAGLEPGAFIPNDCRLGGEHGRVAILTGPNMAGKSTYLRQVALIVLLAQVGSFVPAREAHIGLADRIFTRVGAQDDIAAGQSTFMVEMTETSQILRHASDRSLIVLDEVGRGTSTFDGLSIARAVVEDVHDRLGARTLFATHFHELSDLEGELGGVRVYNAAVAEEYGEVIFLRRVLPGPARRSYGIQVARLAGLPDHVLARARAILGELEARRDGEVSPRPGAAVTARVAQLRLDGFELDADSAADGLDELLTLDLAGLSPVELWQRLAELQRRAGLR